MVESQGQHIAIAYNPEEQSLASLYYKEPKDDDKEQKAEEVRSSFTVVCKSYQSVRDFALSLHKTEKGKPSHDFIKQVLEQKQRFNEEWSSKCLIFQDCNYCLDRIVESLKSGYSKLEMAYKDKNTCFEKEIIVTYFSQIKELRIPQIKEIRQKLFESIETQRYKDLEAKVSEVMNLAQEVLPKYTEKEAKQNKEYIDLFVEKEKKKQAKKDLLQIEISRAILNREHANDEKIRFEKLQNDIKSKIEELETEATRIQSQQKQLRDILEKNDDKQRTDIEKKFQNEIKKRETELNKAKKDIQKFQANREKILVKLHKKLDKLLSSVQAKSGKGKQVIYNLIHALDISLSMQGDPLRFSISNIQTINETRKQFLNDKVTVLFFNKNVVNFASQIAPADLPQLKVEASGGTNFNAVFQQIQFQLEMIDDEQIGIVCFYTDGDAKIDKAMIICQEIREKYKDRELPIYLISIAHSSRCVEENIKKLTTCFNGDLKAKFGSLSFDLYHYCANESELKAKFESLQNLLVELSYPERLTEAYKERIQECQSETEGSLLKMQKRIDEMMIQQNNAQEQYQIHLSRTAEQTNFFLQQSIKNLQFQENDIREEVKKLYQQKEETDFKLQKAIVELKQAEANNFYAKEDEMLEQIDKEYDDQNDEIKQYNLRRKNLIELGQCFSKEEILKAQSQLEQVAQFCNSMKLLVSQIYQQLQGVEDSLSEIVLDVNDKKANLQQEKMAVQVMIQIISEHYNKEVEISDAGTMDEMVLVMLQQMGYSDDELVVDFFKKKLNSLELLYNYIDPRESDQDQQPQTLTSKPKEPTLSEKNKQQLVESMKDHPSQDILLAAYDKMRRTFTTKYEEYMKNSRFDQIGKILDKKCPRLFEQIKFIKFQLSQLMSNKIGEEVKHIQWRSSIPIQKNNLALLN